MARRDAVDELIRASSLPPEDDLISIFVDGTRFTDSEDINWDFKDQWPFSYSDDYFCGISRLIAAFANTAGGIIIFGVHDEKRTGGWNKVAVNLDRLRQSLSQYLGTCPDLEIRSYKLLELGDVDCLMILPRRVGQEPYRFLRPTKYGPSIWVREGHSVIAAQPRHVPMIFCRASEREADKDIRMIAGSVPPAPRTVEKFIGRMQSLSDLFRWLYNSDDPQIYLWGKGGSGKTTIAHEFASIIRKYGRDIRLQSGDQIDLVIFLSAKEKSFTPNDRGKIELERSDFEDETSLYRGILSFSGLYDEADLADKNTASLKRYVEEFFNEFSVLLVIDDIDTLTTKNIESGGNFLYRVLARSKRGSKLLYTQRDLPKHAIESSIEVPGLSLIDEYPEFVSECVRKYNVKIPMTGEISTLADLSERRPLVVEYVIALRRTSPTYDAAFKLFKGDTGNDLREYVFQREWLSLASGTDARSMLAALALINKPVAFEDLLVMLQCGEVRLRDAISSTRDIFLNINDAGNQTSYFLDILTRDFVISESEHISYIATIRARVKTFEKAYIADLPQISRIGIRINDLLVKAFRSNSRANSERAWEIVSETSLPASVSEHPQFRSLYGYVASNMIPYKVNEARSSFAYVLNTNYEPPIEHLRAWFYAERNSGIGFLNCITASDFVSKGRQYTRDEKIEFEGLRAAALYFEARARSIDDPLAAVEKLHSSLSAHCLIYRFRSDKNDGRIARSEELVRNTCYTMMDILKKNFGLDTLCLHVNRIMDLKAGFLDAVEVPLIETLIRVNPNQFEPSILGRARKSLAHLSVMKIDLRYWRDQDAASRVRKAAFDLDRILEGRMKKG